MATIGNKGEELNLLIRQGATFGPNECTLVNPNGTPMNLTGCTFSAQIRKTPSSPTVLASAVFSITNAAQGQFTWEFSETATATLVADDTSETAEASTYVWDMEMQDNSGNILPLVYGAVNVFREVTKT